MLLVGTKQPYLEDARIQVVQGDQFASPSNSNSAPGGVEAMAKPRLGVGSGAAMGTLSL